MQTDRDLLAEWEERLRIAGRAHYLMANAKRRQSQVLNALAIGSTLLSATIAFSTPWSVTTTSTVSGALGVCGAALMLTTFLVGPDESSRLHRVSAAAFFGLRREVEILQVGEKKRRSEFMELQGRYTEISSTSPVPRSAIYERARQLEKGPKG